MNIFVFPFCAFFNFVLRQSFKKLQQKNCQNRRRMFFPSLSPFPHSHPAKDNCRKIIDLFGWKNGIWHLQSNLQKITCLAVYLMGKCSTEKFASKKLVLHCFVYSNRGNVVELSVEFSSPTRKTIMVVVERNISNAKSFFDIFGL